MNESFELSPLGPEGDLCTICKAPLAVDQRYCLQCGQRRGASRVDFAQLIPAEVGPSPGGAQAAAVEVRSTAQGPWTPLALVGSIATLGLMLLLGVMIGKDDSPSQVTAAAPAAAPTVASTGASGTDGSAAATSGGTATADTKGKDGSTDAASSKTAADKSQPASDAPGATTIDDGALQALDNATGQDAADASKNLPDTIALPGEPPPTDNEAPGGGGPAQVIK